MSALTLAAPLLAAALASAEPAPVSMLRLEGAWRLSVGTGGASGGLIDLVDGLDCSGCVNERNLHDPWQINLRLEREVRQRLWLGLAWVYSRWGTRGYDLEPRTMVGSSESSAQTLLAGVSVCWLQTGRLELYSGLAAGVTRHRTFDASGVAGDDAGISVIPALQLRAIGVTGGWERVRFFAEAGVGFEGVLLGGLLVRI